MAIKDVFAGIPVTDYRAARPWYEQLFGRAPDVNVTDHECMWQLATAGWVYIVEDRDRAGHALFTFLVDNLPDHVAAIAARGLKVGDIETTPGVVRVAVIMDADGNRIQIGEDLSEAK